MRKIPVHSQTEHQILQVYLGQFVCIHSHRVHNLHTHGCVQSSMQSDSEDSVQVESWQKSSLKEEREPHWSSLWLKKRNYQKACMKNRQLVSLHYKLVVFYDICVLCSNPQNFDTSPFDRYNMQTVCSAMLNCPQTNSLTATTASSYNGLLLL